MRNVTATTYTMDAGAAKDVAEKLTTDQLVAILLP
jgi:hypothetical protein